MKLRGKVPYALAIAAMLVSACSGGTGSTVTPTTQTKDRTAASFVALPSLVYLYQGKHLGNTATLWPNLGPDSNGGKGQPVDGYTCGSMVDNSYHVHAWLGVLVNGGLEQVPPTIGIKNPGAPTSGYYGTGSCFYNIHTHDASGYIHMEAFNSTPLSGTVFTLGNVLDIWGEKITPTNFGPYVGSVRVFVNRTPLAQDYTPVGAWKEVTSATGLEWTSFRLYSHSAILIEVGPTFVEAAKLPQVRFFTQY